jgi:hypothetical protein
MKFANWRVAGGFSAARRIKALCLCAALAATSATCRGQSAEDDSALLLGWLLAWPGCASHASVHVVTRRAVDLTSGILGAFDPSLAGAPCSDEVWMSYSEAAPSAMWPQNPEINQRLAYSPDAGRTYIDTGVVINDAESVSLPAAPPLDAGTWVYETSDLLFDPYAPVGARWKIMFHRYLWVDGVQKFAHGWIGYREASSPLGPWSAERKLFVGFVYDASNDAIIGPPEVYGSASHADLAACGTFTEPGLLARPDGVYVALYCAAATIAGGKIVLFKQARNTDQWTYVGTMLRNQSDAPALGYSGFSAAELFSRGPDLYLTVSPTGAADDYQGCLIMNVTNLSAAAVMRVAGTPQIALRHIGATPFNGACSYTGGASGSGIVYFEKNGFVSTIYATGLVP